MPAWSFQGGDLSEFQRGSSLGNQIEEEEEDEDEEEWWIR
jgi:hypothetical protein